MGYIANQTIGMSSFISMPQRIHYGEDFASEQLNILRKARILAHQHTQQTGQITKDVTIMVISPIKGLE